MERFTQQTTIENLYIRDIVPALKELILWGWGRGEEVQKVRKCNTVWYVH